MIDGTTLMSALPRFRILNVTLNPAGGRLVLVESSAKEGSGPSCGVIFAADQGHVDGNETGT
jgi:hypothetical protein